MGFRVWGTCHEDKDKEGVEDGDHGGGGRHNDSVKGSNFPEETRYTEDTHEA